MGKTKKIFKKARPWQVVALTALVAAITIGAYVFPRLSEQGGAQQPPPTEGLDAAADAQEPANREIPVNGRLVYSQRAELTFGTTGEVGEILVQEGERVKEGQVLARLDSLTIAGLKEARAQALFDLEQAQDELARARKAEFTGALLERARFEEAVAKAKNVLTDAQERLRDFQRDQQRELAAARKAKADAELALDEARQGLNHYNRDHVQRRAAAQKRVSDAEMALDTATNALMDFEEDYQEDLANARLKKAQAEATLEQAEEELTAFLRNPANDVREGELIDVEILERLKAAEAEARTNLEQTQRKLTQLEGNRALLLQERQSAVETTQADLAEARDTVEQKRRPSSLWQMVKL
jgi:HlyD family secretion protein